MLKFIIMQVPVERKAFEHCGDAGRVPGGRGRWPRRTLLCRQMQVVL